MKPLLIASLFAFAVPSTAEAGDFSLDLGIRRGKVRVGVRYDDRKHRHRKVRHRKVVRHRPAGYYKTVARKVWVRGHYERRYVPARYSYRYDRCGRRIRYCVAGACYRRVWVPGYYRTQYQKVWVSGHRHR